MKSKVAEAIKLKNHPVALDEEMIDRLYHEILR